MDQSINEGSNPSAFTDCVVNHQGAWQCIYYIYKRGEPLQLSGLINHTPVNYVINPGFCATQK